MKSMTSYGYSEYSDSSYTMTFEIKSVNNRFLDISCNIPSVLNPLENDIVNAIKEKTQRGHIDVFIKIRNSMSDTVIDINEDLASSYLEAFGKLSNLAKNHGFKIAKTDIEKLMDFNGVVSDSAKLTTDDYKAGVGHCLAEALKQFEASKNREGLVTKQDLKSKIDSIEKSLGIVKSHASEIEDNIKKGLYEKINEVLADKDYDENRILTEVAVMLMRYTINEEIVRLSAHIAEFNRLLESDEPVGKRMDFLSQEMNREINTIGSKSQIVEINFEVVNMKDCLENIREQIRNIE